MEGDLSVYEKTLASQQASMDKYQDELFRLNSELAKAKRGQRASIRQAIRNIEQQIRKLTASMRKTQENITEQTLALQGIDQQSAGLGNVSGIVGGTASIVSALMGAPGLSGIVGAKQETEQTQITADSNVQMNKDDEKGKSKSNSMMFIVIGVVALLFFMKK